MPARLRGALLIAVLLVAGACGSTSSISKHLSSAEPHIVTISSINVVSSTVGPVVVGEVHNLSPAAISGVQLTTSVTIGKGAPGEPMEATTLLHVVPGGGHASFSIPFPEVHGTATAVKANVQAEPIIAIPYAPLSVTLQNRISLGHDIEVTGTVTNSSGKAVTFPNVVATFYNRSGAVVGAAHSVGTSDTVTPGATAPFDIILVDDGPLVSHYSLAAEGQVVAPSQ
ncbi:MAG TPA: FxLYD domain-containing protein [Actinomycetota bacterium]|nr:FxLYD domain-containing protein [Actinomycetota bacterium]